MPQFTKHVPIQEFHTKRRAGAKVVAAPVQKICLREATTFQPAPAQIRGILTFYLSGASSQKEICRKFERSSRLALPAFLAKRWSFQTAHGKVQHRHDLFAGQVEPVDKPASRSDSPICPEAGKCAVGNPQLRSGVPWSKRISILAARCKMDKDAVPFKSPTNLRFYESLLRTILERDENSQNYQRTFRPLYRLNVSSQVITGISSDKA